MEAEQQVRSTKDGDDRIDQQSLADLGDRHLLRLLQAMLWDGGGRT
jgi:hypothetical protein